MSDSNDTLIITETTEQSPDTVSTDPVSPIGDAAKHVDEAKTSDEAPTSPTPNQDGDSPEEPLNLEFNRTNIEALGNHVHLVSDEDSKLDMFCYVKCSETDNSLLKQCRGVVFHEQELVMKAFPYTTEYCHTDLDEINTALGEFKEWTFYEAHEGALVRMFHFSGKWFVSTHRKLNAFRSKWASRDSFGTSFKNALSAEEEANPAFKAALPDGENILERFQTTLDTSKQYMFLIRNNKDNRIVCSAPDRATVYHVGTFVDGALVFTEDINLPTPAKLTFLNVDELQSHVEKISYKDLQGVIGFTEDNRQVKIVHKDYQDLFRARGNEPSIKFRYLQIRMNRRFVNMLYHLYPDMAETFDEYENTLYDIARSIYRAYVQRFIKNRYVTVPREEFAIIRECHSWHLADRGANRISINKVVQVMNQQSPTHLNHMIRRFKLEQTRQKDQQNMTRPRSDSVRSVKSFEQSPAVRKIKTAQAPVSPLLLSNNASSPGGKKQRGRLSSIGPPAIGGGEKRGRQKTKQTTILPRKPLYKPKGAPVAPHVADDKSED